MKPTAAASPLRHPGFRRLWLGLSISYLGDQFTIIALLWFVLQLTGSGAAVGLVILCFNLPGVATTAGVRAFVPHLVDDAALDRANALTATSMQFSYLAGPLAGGFAVARLGGPWALFVDAASFLLMALLALTLPKITREPLVAPHAAANRWLGFGALFGV